MPTWRGPVARWESAAWWLTALWSDIHWGLFGWDHQLEHLVDRLNALRPDAVLVAGDWICEPRRHLAGGLAPLARLQMPVFAVLGNHDLQPPACASPPNCARPCSSTASRSSMGAACAGAGWELVGIDDLWGGGRQPQIRSLLAVPPTIDLISLQR